MMYGDAERSAENRSWSEFEQWNVLFEALCTIRGFAVVNDLAHTYCLRMRKQAQRDVDAAARSINNWRSGSHAPSARNLAILADILDVASDPALNEAWRTLYRKAKSQPDSPSNATVAVRPDSSWMTTLFQGGRRRIVYVFAALVVAAASVSGFATWHAGGQASVALERPIPFRSKVAIKVSDVCVPPGFSLTA